MSQHDFNIANQSFPATRTDLNNALVALASNSSGDAEPATKYANQWWYETDTNTLKLRNEANDAWISIAVLDQSGNAVQSITTAGLTLGSTAISATGAEINQLDAITRGSILYGNASGATARLAAGGASTVLTSDGTDIAWAAAGGAYGTSTTAFSILTVNAAGNGYEWIPRKDAMYLPPASLPADWANPTSTYTSSGTWSKGALADDTIVWFYIVAGGGGGGGRGGSANGGTGGAAGVFYGTASYFDGAQYTIGAAGSQGGSGDQMGGNGGASSIVLSAGSGGATLTTGLVYKTPDATFLPGSVSSGGIIITSAPALTYGVTNPGTGGGSGGNYNGSAGGSSVFGAGGGGGLSGSAGAGGSSTYAGNGGSNGDAAAPGGGGGARSGTGGAGQAGNLRVYVIT
jgi:hypothetical protein